MEVLDKVLMILMAQGAVIGVLLIPQVQICIVKVNFCCIWHRVYLLRRIGDDIFRLSDGKLSDEEDYAYLVESVMKSRY